MRKATLVVGPSYLENKLFDLSNPILNRDNCLLPFYELKQKLEEVGYLLATQDVNLIKNSEIIIYNEMPKGEQVDPSKRNFLLLFETELIRPDNWDLSKHKLFEKVFTWNDQFVDGKKYIKMNFPNKLRTPEINTKRDKFAVLISGNKSSNHPKELYSKRLETIRWFEKYHPNEFDYFGIGWDEFRLGQPFLDKVLRKLKISRLVPFSPSPCYRGKVDKKDECLKKYYFSVCYENAFGFSGYITEKIFDCLFAGSIPVYWGADNIGSYVPEDCYIDRKRFKDHEEMYVFLKSLGEDQIQEYQKNIIRYLNSEEVKQFSSTYFANLITGEVIREQ